MTIIIGIQHINNFKYLFLVNLSKKENFKKHLIGYDTKRINRIKSKNIAK
jgi:hypothetical protein